jgi:hypothetical protein
MTVTLEGGPAMIRALVILGVLAASAIRPEAASGQATYETGKRHWLQGVYQGAYDTLLDYRRQSFARKPEVDYMIGTSACRLDCCRDWGGRFLAALPESYPLTVESRKIVDTERVLCQQAAAMPPPVADGPDKLQRMVAAGVSGRAKVFSTADESVGVTTYPARRVRPIAAAEFLGRLTPLGNPDRAVATATAIAGTPNAVAYQRLVITSQSGHTRQQLDQIAGILGRFLDFLAERYGMILPEQYVTVHLVPTPARLRQVALRAHGLDVTPGTIGYAFQEDLSIVAFVTGTAAGTVLHELVHLSVRGTFGDIPQWLDEGLAGLYEVSTAYPDGVYGEPNWRGPVLDRLWHRRPAVGTLIATPWFPFDIPEVRSGTTDIGSPQGEDLVAFMATARYFCLFLERKGHLVAVYRAVRDRDIPTAQAPSEAARVALEQAFGAPLARIDAEFAAWFKGGVPSTAAMRRGTSGTKIQRQLPAEGGSTIDKELPPPR